MKLYEIKNTSGYLSGFKTIEEWEKKVQQVYPDALIRKRDDGPRWIYIARTKEDWKEQDKKPVSRQDASNCLARAAILKKDNYFVADLAGIWTKDFKSPSFPKSDLSISKVERLNPFKPGDRVKLKANEEEGWDEQFGTVIDNGDIIPQVYKGKGRSETIVVKVDDKYLEDDSDDGIREVHVDDVERTKK